LLGTILPRLTWKIYLVLSHSCLMTYRADATVPLWVFAEEHHGSSTTNN